MCVSLTFSWDASDAYCAFCSAVMKKSERDTDNELDGELGSELYR
jgi:hypothetical protein